MIALSGITLTFPDGESRLTAVDDVSLRVAAGTAVAITGPSGSGKSSLLAVASTLITPDEGQVVIEDVDATALDLPGRATLRRDRIGLVFQQSNLLGSLTALEQLLVMGELSGHRNGARAESRERAGELLDAVGLGSHTHKRPAQLSGGQRQRVNIARALMNRPAVLIVDEPTSALDQANSMKIIDLVLGLTADYATATLLVTHDQGVLPRMDAAYAMVDGSLTPIR